MPERFNKLVNPPSSNYRDQALARQACLTKPPGSLGRLEELAVRLAAIQRCLLPRIDQIWINVFAADHGVASEGVSAFPQEVTFQMVRNFANGGAAINVLARELGAKLEVIDVGIVTTIPTLPRPALPKVVSVRVGAGTANILHDHAMSMSQLSMALDAGEDAVKRALDNGCDLYIGGEMGICNTTSASALGAVLLGVPPEALVGRGTGLDDAGQRHKLEVVRRAIARDPISSNDPVAAMRSFGGFEIVALAGAYNHAARQGVPVLVDGFISTVSALIAVQLQPTVKPWLIFAHRSREPGHGVLLNAMGVQPLIELDLCLGEASGAALAVPLLRLACALHRDMATFEEADVANRSGE